MKLKFGRSQSYRSLYFGGIKIIDNCTLADHKINDSFILTAPKMIDIILLAGHKITDNCILTVL